MDSTALVINVVVPAAMFALMTTIGLDLGIGDFRHLLRRPRALLAGTIAQLIALPILAASLIGVLPLTAGETGALIIFAACPGGGLSNIMAAKAGANVALSVSYTVCTSVLAILTIPLLTAAGFALFLDRQSAISVPLAPMLGQLWLLVFVPLCLGMWLRYRYAAAVQRHYRTINRVGNLLLAGIVVMALAADHGVSGRAIVDALPAAVAFSVGAALLGWLIGTALRLPAAERTALLIEFCVRNAGVATLIILVTLDNIAMVPLLAAIAAVQAVLVSGVAALCRLAGLPRAASAANQSPPPS